MSQANSPRRRPNVTGQQSLFDEPVQAAGSSALLALSTPAAAQSTAQRAFKRLIAQIQQQRLLRPETIAQLNPELRRVLALDDPRNDALSTTGSGKSGFLR